MENIEKNGQYQIPKGYVFNLTNILPKIKIIVIRTSQGKIVNPTAVFFWIYSSLEADKQQNTILRCF